MFITSRKKEKQSSKPSEYQAELATNPSWHLSPSPGFGEKSQLKIASKETLSGASAEEESQGVSSIPHAVQVHCLRDLAGQEIICKDTLMKEL